MCGRFLLTVDLAEIVKRFGLRPVNIVFEPKAEIFPSESVPILIEGEEKKLQLMKWGFKPAFTDKLLINARSETVDEKPTFKTPFLTKRCIIPANGFFEWKKINNENVKHKITLKSGGIFGFAGLYNTFRDKYNNPYEAFTILTTAPNEQMKNLHHRMPVILEKSAEKLWLDPKLQDIGLLKGFLKPFHEELSIESLDAGDVQLTFPL
ncbi:Putative SOS response-associated peptidase YedK [Natronincola peptidivorans]|uniref:Abasic site processing protein n=1 Tax=Natronincola peptidivorans TaxID=426128 RepID=A0A1I0FKL5_9FIRM|nr:SOS response-associated peptidase [Natronincola peptidivorans]SET58795.1 Putative SOS response-associated peptidase YedK [Natronincola peptidivorans]